jgi:uncharacterized membrane protein HdeD (DUF308 family)
MSTAPAVTAVREYAGWSILFSIVLIIAGILAIALPVVAGIGVNLVVGWLLIFGGAAHIVFAWQTRSTGGVVWGILIGLIYAVVGGYLLANPLIGLVSLTLGLAFYLFAESILEFILSYELRSGHGAGWVLLDAIITLILAVMIWRTWPFNSEWVLGTLVGISMLFSGVSRLMLSVAVRRAVQNRA